MHVMAGHTAPVTCVIAHADAIVSGAKDATLRVWAPAAAPSDGAAGACAQMAVLRRHAATVTDVRRTGEAIVSASVDGTIVVWVVRWGGGVEVAKF
jgi:WD40 repeat protein